MDSIFGHKVSDLKAYQGGIRFEDVQWDGNCGYFVTVAGVEHHLTGGDVEADPVLHCDLCGLGEEYDGEGNCTRKLYTSDRLVACNRCIVEKRR